jgi:hypothetical protein
LIVILNNNRQPVAPTLCLEGYLGDGTRLSGVWDDQAVSVIEGQVQGITVPARTGLVLRVVAHGWESTHV